MNILLRDFNATIGGGGGPFWTGQARLQIEAMLFFFCNPILFAISTSTFTKLCKNMYTVAWRRVLSSAPL
jgi:hypothetical protein